jgi:prepilin signal peptidase PulO-like enzyme (type II secretory pathway)
MIEILLSAAAFAAAGALGIVAARYVCAGMMPAADGPPPGTVSVQLLIVANALLGALAGMRGLSLGQLAIVALVCGVLSAIWVADVTLGIIPDVFTLAPLGAVILAAVLSHHWEVAISAVVPAVPFAVLAWRSGGIGLGWGDVKLAALGGTLIGLQGALMAFALGCGVAVIVARVRGVSGKPVAFGPYLATAIALPLVLLMPIAGG